MIGIITSKTQELYGRRPRWPFALNRDSWQAEGLVAWWPLGIHKDALDLVNRKWNLTNSGPTLAVDQMMGRTHDFVKASSQFFSLDSAVLTATPLTFAAWALSDDVAANQVIIEIHNSASSASRNYFLLWMVGSVAGDPVRAQTGDPANNASAATTKGYVANTWHHCCAVFASATSRAAYIDGGGKGTNATSRIPSGLNKTTIGVLDGVTPAEFMSGKIADGRIYKRVLSDQEVFLLWHPETRWDLYYPIGRRVVFIPPQAAPGVDVRKHVISVYMRTA